MIPQLFIFLINKKGKRNILTTSEEQNFDLAKLISIRVWYVHADQINFIS